MWYTYEDNPSNFISLTVENVKKIQELNAKNKKAESLEEYTEGVVEESVKFDNVIGQDDLTRFDSKDKPKRKNNRNSKRNNGFSKRRQNANNKDGERKSQNYKSSAKSNDKKQGVKQNQITNKTKQRPNHPKAQGDSNSNNNQNRSKRKFRNKQSNNPKPNQDTKA
jgi:hypothetical protein